MGTGLCRNGVPGIEVGQSLVEQRVEAEEAQDGAPVVAAGHRVLDEEQVVLELVARGHGLLLRQQLLQQARLALHHQLNRSERWGSIEIGWRVPKWQASSTNLTRRDVESERLLLRLDVLEVVGHEVLHLLDGRRVLLVAKALQVFGLLAQVAEHGRDVFASDLDKPTDRFIAISYRNARESHSPQKLSKIFMPTGKPMKERTNSD